MPGGSTPPKNAAPRRGLGVPLPYTFGYPADDDPDGVYECYLDFSALEAESTKRLRGKKY